MWHYCYSLFVYSVPFVYSVLGFGSESDATMDDLFIDETIDRKITFNGMLFICIFLFSWFEACVRKYTRSCSIEVQIVSRQKQTCIGVFIKKCSENMQQIYRRTPMPNCGITLGVNFLHIFRTFPENTSGLVYFSVN